MADSKESGNVWTRDGERDPVEKNSLLERIGKYGYTNRKKRPINLKASCSVNMFATSDRALARTSSSTLGSPFWAKLSSASMNTTGGSPLSPGMAF
jgi:hypothetical protein